MSRRVFLLLLFSLAVNMAVAQRPFYAVGWGSNSGGRLGRRWLSTAPPAAGPGELHMGNVSQPGVIKNIKTILGGAQHGIAITMDDNILAWGDNSYHQLGVDYSIVTTYLPVFIRPFFGGPKIQLATSGYTSFSLAPNEPWQPASIFGWGANTPKLIPNATTTVTYPEQIAPPGAAHPLKFVVDFQCSLRHCVALFEDGRVEGWGNNADYPVLPCIDRTDIYCNFDLNAYLNPNEKVNQISVSNLYTILVTNTSSMVVLGKNVFFPVIRPLAPLPPDIVINTTRIEANQLPIECRPNANPPSPGINKIVSGLDFTLLLCNNSFIFGFGNNVNLQLGAEAGDKVNLTNAVPMNISNVDRSWNVHPPGQPAKQFKSIAAGEASGYALTDDGQVWGWGSGQQMAMASLASIVSNLPLNITIEIVPFIRMNYTTLDISAHMSAHGAWIRLGEKMIGRCPVRPSGMDFGYCDARGYYTFTQGAVANGTMYMPQGMVLVGNVTMNGTSDMRFPHGVAMEGFVQLHGRALAVFSDRNDLIGDLEIFEDAELELSNGFLTINGSITLGENATLTFSNLTFDAITIGSNSSKRLMLDSDNSTESTAVISAESEITLDGNVTIIVSSETVQAMLEAGNQGENTNVTTSILLATAETVSGKTTSFTIELLETTYDSCQSVSSSAENDGSSITVLLSLNSDECTPTPSISSTPSPSTSPSKSSSKLVPIIAGSIGGAVALAVVVTAVLVVTVPSVKMAILPYHMSN